MDTLTPQMDITALREHYEQLKRDIAEDGQAVDKDPDKYGNSPSGVALRFMYAGLDLKCNLMENEFKLGFEQLLFFVDEYLKITGKGDFTAVGWILCLTAIWRSMKVNRYKTAVILRALFQTAQSFPSIHMWRMWRKNLKHWKNSRMIPPGITFP